MKTKMTRIAGGAALAAALLLGGGTAASATTGGELWTMTSCDFNGGHVSYTYTSGLGNTFTAAASVGPTFIGTEGQLLHAVVEQLEP